MKFPSESLLLLLDFIRGKHPLDSKVIDAGVEVLTYAWDLISEQLKNKDAMPEAFGDVADAESCITSVLSQHENNSKGLTPMVWVTIGLWVLEQILKRRASKD